MSAAHTPGPWVWDEDTLRPPHVCIYACDPHGEYHIYEDSIVETDGGHYGPRDNDRPLIAAAPDLLVALRPFAEQSCVNAWRSVDHIGCPWCRAREAVAKAEGR